MKKRGQLWDAVKDCGSTQVERRAIRLAFGEAETIGDMADSLDTVSLVKLVEDLTPDDQTLARTTARTVLDFVGSVMAKHGKGKALASWEEAAAKVDAAPMEAPQSREDWQTWQAWMKGTPNPWGAFGMLVTCWEHASCLGHCGVMHWPVSVIIDTVGRQHLDEIETMARKAFGQLLVDRLSAAAGEEGA